MIGAKCKGDGFPLLRNEIKELAWVNRFRNNQDFMMVGDLIHEVLNSSAID